MQLGEERLEAEAGAAPDSSALAWYYRLIGKIQDAVRDAVPANSTVLVVSRGDDELIRLGNREGWHFPRHADGRYGGFHPADSAAAIAHLEALRERGAQYIVFPASARWWLDYYAEFADHLNSRYSVVADDEATCTIYELRPQFETKAIKEGLRISPHLEDYVKTLLPDGALAVLRSPESRMPLRGRETITFPSLDFEGDTPAALEELDTIAADGVRFFVVPHGSPSWLDDHPGFLSEVDRRHRLIASQRHVCTVFELCPPGAAEDRSSRGPLAERLKSRWRRALSS
jgi:hypothetical protein